MNILRYVIAYGALVIVLLADSACPMRSFNREGDAISTASLQVTNLHAFGRLYGVLRWFHPSDAAALVDWDRFAVEGVRRVIDAPNPETLRAVLKELFTPFAPTVRITKGDEKFEPPVLSGSAGPTGLESVEWEHRGYGDSTLVSEYISKRRHRPRAVPVPGMPQVALWQAVDAAPFRGARLRLRGKLRVANRGRGRLWIRVERGDRAGFSDTMSERPLVSSDWQLAEIIGKVDADATRIVFGTMMNGGGVVWYDDLDLAVETPNGTWRLLTIKDPGFESSNWLDSWGIGTGHPADASFEGWNVTLDHEHAVAGQSSLRVEPAFKMITDELFTEAPQPGEIVEIDLGRELHAHIPISLYSRNGHTIGDDLEQVRQLRDSNPSIGSDGFDKAVAIADVLIVWNALQHFWPYWDLISTDWTVELDRALILALAEHDINDHLSTLRYLSAIAADGHATSTCPGSSPRERPPFLVDIVEGQVVITATADKAIVLGDVVMSLDGQSALKQLSDDQARASGSSQWRLVRARQQFGMGPPGSYMSLRIRRGVNQFDVSVMRNKNTLREFEHPAIEHFADDIYYIDLNRAEMSDITKNVDALASARGIVLDVRGSPNSNHKILSYLLEQPVEVAPGMAIAHVIRPDHSRFSVPSWTISNDPLLVRKPHIRARVAFLTGPATTSYAETIMTLVAQHHLGAMVGSATGGTNGNVAEITTPTGCRTRFTGLRATKPDGSRFHLIGIQPTISASRTIAGVAAGRDEVLERALTYVRTEAK
jgi:C-terminal processing protease CtpA/Prc